MDDGFNTGLKPAWNDFFTTGAGLSGFGASIVFKETRFSGPVKDVSYSRKVIPNCVSYGPRRNQLQGYAGDS